MKSYNGTTKPEDWLENYVTAVDIAGGNRRWAVRYIPQMLEGAARLWLNNLPENSIEHWLDFSDAFITNFTSTYKRPNRPQQLAACRQRDNETDREYLTRWSNVRNSCEGVNEQQAISWFAQGCRHGSMLWQKLQREMPSSLAETIKIADMYALGDPTLPADMPAERRGNDGAGSSRQNRPDFRNKRREDRPDFRYGSNQVAAIEQEPVDAGSSQRPRTDQGPRTEVQQQWTQGPKRWPARNDNKKPWDSQRRWQNREKYTFEKMLDQPCTHHTLFPDKPAEIGRAHV